VSEQEEIELRQNVEKGNRVQEILADPVYQEAVEATKKRLFEEWQQSPLDATPQREGAYFALKGLVRVQEMLSTYSNAGAHAAHTLRLKGKRN